MDITALKKDRVKRWQSILDKLADDIVAGFERKLRNLTDIDGRHRVLDLSDFGVDSSTGKDILESDVDSGGDYFLYAKVLDRKGFKFVYEWGRAMYLQESVLEKLKEKKYRVLTNSNSDFVSFVDVRIEA